MRSEQNSVDAALLCTHATPRVVFAGERLGRGGEVAGNAMHRADWLNGTTLQASQLNRSSFDLSSPLDLLMHLLLVSSLRLNCA